MAKLTFICEKREDCPKYTRDKCDGKAADSYFSEARGKKIHPYVSDSKCVQEPWQKKLNEIKGAPDFVLQGE